MAEIRLNPQSLAAYAELEKAGAAQLLDAIDDALDLLEASPGDPKARRKSFTGGVWGIPVRDRTSDWLITDDDIRSALNRRRGQPRVGSNGKIVVLGYASGGRILKVVLTPDQEDIITVMWLDD